MRTLSAGNAEPAPRAPVAANTCGAVDEGRRVMVNRSLRRGRRGEFFAGWSAGRGFFCPSAKARDEPKSLFQFILAVGTASALPPCCGLGEPAAHGCLGQKASSTRKGRFPMENALLVGLSRQMALSNELDIVANNIANIDTTGYKSDNALFGAFLMRRARRRFCRQRPARQLRAGARKLDRFQPGRIAAHRQSARRRHRATPSSRCRRRAAALHA